MEWPGLLPGLVLLSGNDDYPAKMILRCVKNLGGTIVLANASPDLLNEYVRSTCTEYYWITPDMLIFRETRIELESPMLIGFQAGAGKLLLPFTKRCTGTVLIELDAAKEDFDCIRAWALNHPPMDIDQESRG